MMVEKFEVGKKYQHSQVAGDATTRIATCIAITSVKSTPILEFGSGSITTVGNEGLYSYWSEYKEPKRGTIWVNIYEDHNNRLCYPTREKADECAPFGRKRIACVEVPWVEGQGLE